MARRPRLSDRLCETLDDVKDEYEYNTDEQAIRKIMQQAGYDV